MVDFDFKLHGGSLKHLWNSVYTSIPQTFYPEEEESPRSWPGTQLGLGVLLLDINSFSEHQHQTSPFWDSDG